MGTLPQHHRRRADSGFLNQFSKGGDGVVSLRAPTWMMWRAKSWFNRSIRKFIAHRERSSMSVACLLEHLDQVRNEYRWAAGDSAVRSASWTPGRETQGISTEGYAVSSPRAKYSGDLVMKDHGILHQRILKLPFLDRIRSKPKAWVEWGCTDEPEPLIVEQRSNAESWLRPRPMLQRRKPMPHYRTATVPAANSSPPIELGDFHSPRILR